MAKKNKPKAGVLASAQKTEKMDKAKKTSKKALTKSPKQKTVGPVPDLETHLPRDWWKSLFNSLYLKTDGDVVENHQNTRQEIDLLIESTQLQPESRILDLCCGQGRHCLELARRGYRQVTGIDRSQYLLRLAKKRAKDRGANITFHEGDARKTRYPDSTFDCVILMGNSFGYFEHQDDDREVLRNVFRLLKPDGTIAIDLTDGQWMRENYVDRSWEWIDQKLLVNRERKISDDNSRLISRELVVDSDNGIMADQFYAERLYSFDELKTVMLEVGFTDIQNHGRISADSTRGQDLGMMASRLFLTGRVKKKAKIAAKKPLRPKVTVLLGDPQLPDEVKLAGCFNDDDVTTVNKLKEALASLDDYHFNYFDDHTTLIHELRTNPPEFVLNFCDEGFWNDPQKELHVPALLETLNIPYTGSGPLTLGLCYDKSMVSVLASAMEIPVPLETYIHPEDNTARLPSVFPALLKPSTGDSSQGITKDAVVHNSDELVAYFEYLRSAYPNRAILIQEFLTGPEYTVGLIGNPDAGFEQLPIMTVDYGKLPKTLPHILGYESKWDPDSPYWQNIHYVEATHLNEATRRLLYDYSVMLFERFGCRDYARFDFRAGRDGVIKLLEINPNPGWCWDGKFNLMGEMMGLTYSQMLEKVLQVAEFRLNGKTMQSSKKQTFPIG